NRVNLKKEWYSISANHELNYNEINSAKLRRRINVETTNGISPIPDIINATIEVVEQGSIVKLLVKELQCQANPNIIIALVGNKIDPVQDFEDDEEDMDYSFK
ncbi:12505_t:CDS:2, partial [Gigaspora margarita]